MAQQPPPPPLPKLDGELMLEVFSHKSLRFQGAPAINQDTDFGSNERLATVGDAIRSAVVTTTLFGKRPMLEADAIKHQRDDFLSPRTIEDWIRLYRLKDKLRCTPDARQKLEEPEEAAHLLNSYIGAVYLQSGMDTVQNWIGRLVDPNFEPSSVAGVPLDEPYSYKRAKTEDSVPPPPLTQDFSMPPPPPANPPPPLPGNPLSPAQPMAAFLPLFNQTANQRRLSVEYPAQFSGPAHAGRWSVQCIVNGVAKGSGTGASKQLAKEEAAKQAYYAMGWAPRA